jgi:hypothetical protein
MHEDQLGRKICSTNGCKSQGWVALTGRKRSDYTMKRTQEIRLYTEQARTYVVYFDFVRLHQSQLADFYMTLAPNVAYSFYYVNAKTYFV